MAKNVLRVREPPLPWNWMLLGVIMLFLMLLKVIYS